MPGGRLHGVCVSPYDVSAMKQIDVVAFVLFFCNAAIG